MIMKRYCKDGHNGINDFADNTGVNSMADYATDLTAEQLDRDGTTLKNIHL